MTRKDYELIADALRHSVSPFLGEDDYTEVVMEFSKKLVGTNPNFKRQKFVERCWSK